MAEPMVRVPARPLLMPTGARADNEHEVDGAQIPLWTRIEGAWEKQAIVLLQCLKIVSTNYCMLLLSVFCEY